MKRIIALVLILLIPAIVLKMNDVHYSLENLEKTEKTSLKEIKNTIILTLTFLQFPLVF